MSPCSSRRMQRLARGARLLLLTSAAASGCGPERPPPPAAPTVTVEIPAFDIVAALKNGDPKLHVLRQEREMPVQAVPAASLDRATTLASDADDLVIAARAESAFEIEVGPLTKGSHLRAKTMVYSQFRSDPEQADPAPATFRILVDGVERASIGSEYVRKLKGHEHPYDQLMRTLDVPLDEAAGRTAVLRFETTRAGVPVPEGAVPAETAWWELTILQPVEVERPLASAARPNLLVLVVDTLAAKRMSLYGYARDTTPNLQAFAAQGTLYTTAVAPSSWTLPATASMLTGLPPNTHGVLGDTRSYLMDGLRTWPELLHEEGLEGAAFVANPLIAEANNFQQGFGSLWNQANEAPASELNERLLAWLDGQPPSRRWFAYVHYMDPHAPYGAPGDERGRFASGYTERRDFAGLLPGLLQEAKIEPFDARAQQHVIDLYDGEVAYFDRCFGELLSELDRRGLRDKTIVVLTADHGEELFEHGRLGHGYSLYDELLWVPLVCAGPGIKAGERKDAPVSTASIAATMARWGGIEPLEGMEPPLVGPAPRPERPAGDPIFSAVRTSLFAPKDSPPRNLVSARDAHGRKAIAEVEEADGQCHATVVELYSLASDPGEHAPLDPATLTEEERAAYERLVRRIEEWACETARQRLPEPQPYNEHIREELQQNGYFGRPSR